MHKPIEKTRKASEPKGIFFLWVIGNYTIEKT